MFCFFMVIMLFYVLVIVYFAFCYYLLQYAICCNVGNLHIGIQNTFSTNNQYVVT